MNDGRVAAITEELAMLLKDQPHQAKFMGDIGRASSHGLEAAAPLYQSLEMWGGSGSLADMAGVDLLPNQRRRVHELIVALFDEFEQAGIHHPRAPFWASAFRAWLKDGIFEGGAS